MRSLDFNYMLRILCKSIHRMYVHPNAYHESVLRFDVCLAWIPVCAYVHGTGRTLHIHLHIHYRYTRTCCDKDS
jgi:hypothetical protein